MGRSRWQPQPAILVALGVPTTQALLWEVSHIHQHYHTWIGESQSHEESAASCPCTFNIL